jgi:glycosyltransferase involved in cell wall biosynthesis
MESRRSKMEEDKSMISVVLATHNEAANLGRCLDSVKDFADEIIIADGESTDETIKIAHHYHAKVIQTTNKSNFHINKQIAMDAAKGELILQLDADEVVDSELSKYIHTIDQQIKAGEELPAAWWIKRKNWFMGSFLKKGGQYPDPVIRLYQKGKAHLPAEDVHEQMMVQGNVGWASGHILHYGNPTFAEYLRKFNTYTSFKAEQLYERGVSISFFNTISYLKIKPTITFFSLYLRHRGYVDGIPGFTFALFSGFHHATAYIKLWEIYEKKRLKKP